MRVAFGGRHGLALFLGTLSVLGLALRLDVLINDSFTVLNTLYNLADGHLHFATVPFGDDTTPGDHLVDGRRYGRNYGQAAFALPFLVVFRLAAGVAPVRVVGVLAWLAVTGGFLVVVRRATGREDLVAAGAAVASLLVVASVLVWPPFPKGDPTTLALVTSTAVAGALAAVFVYRLLAAGYGERVGLLGGVAAVFVLPVGLWSVAPKRHALVTALVLGSLYALARSHTADSRRGHRLARAGAYASVGLLSWVHAPEAAGLFLVLVAVDVPTAQHSDPGTLAVVAAVFGLSVVPTLATNVAVAGNPLEPPRLWPEFAPGPEPGGTPGGSGFGDGGDTGGIGGFAGGAVATLSLFVGRYAEGLAVLGQPVRLVRVFLWSGTAAQEIVVPPFRPGTNLSVFESAPVLGGLGGAVGAGLGRLRRRGWRALVATPSGLPGPAVAYALAAAGGYLLLYLPSLPLRVQLTSRYLTPLYPLLFVCLVAVGVNRRAVGAHGRLCWQAFLVTTVGVAAGVPLVAWLLDFHLGQVLLVHAALNLLGWALLAGLSGVAGYRDAGGPRLAVAFGLAAGLGTALLVDLWFVYLHHGPSLLPAVEWGTRAVWSRLVVF